MKNKACGAAVDRGGEKRAAAISLLDGAIVAPGARPGEFRASIASAAFFHKSLMLLFAGGSVVGAIHYLTFKGALGPLWPAVASPCYMLIIVPGALRLMGRLNASRLGLVFANALLFLCFSLLQCSGADLYNKVFFLSYALSPGALFYWMFREPEISGMMGLRRETFAKDVAFAVAVAAAVAMWGAAFFAAWGYEPKGFLPRLITRGAVDLPVNLVIFTFVYSVWTRMRKFGSGFAAELLSFIPLIMALTVSPFAAFFLAGRVSGVSASVAFVMNSLLYSLVCGLTFRRLKSPLAAAMIQTAMMILLDCAGIR